VSVIQIKKVQSHIRYGGIHPITTDHATLSRHRHLASIMVARTVQYCAVLCCTVCLPVLVPGKKYPETGIRFLYDKPPAII